MQRYKNLVVLLLVLLIITLGGGVWYKKFNRKPDTKEQVNITNVDLTNEEVDKIPANFPKDIPLQESEIVESYEMEYPDRGVVVSIVKFETYRGAAELFESYKKSLTAIGYFIYGNETSAEDGRLHLINSTSEGNDFLTITILEKEGGQDDIEHRLVNMIYTTNK